MLDIGCGWGALICHAAQHYGVRAHGVTLAEEQFRLAREKIARLGLQDRVTVELIDYSALDARSTRSPRSECSSMSRSPNNPPISTPSSDC